MNKEYYIIGNTFAAPFFSDTISKFIKATNPEKAILKFMKESKHPCGMYLVNCYSNSDSYHKGNKPLAKWLCNLEIEKQRITKGLGAYIYLGKDNGKFEIDKKEYTVKDWEKGRIVRS